MIFYRTIHSVVIAFKTHFEVWSISYNNRKSHQLSIIVQKCNLQHRNLSNKPTGATDIVESIYILTFPMIVVFISVESMKFLWLEVSAGLNSGIWCNDLCTMSLWPQNEDIINFIPLVAALYYHNVKNEAIVAAFDH